MFEHVEGFAAELVEAVLAYAIHDLRLQAHVAAGDQAPRLKQRAADLSDLRSRVGACAGCRIQVRI